jgi:hypothetical protein
MRLSGMQHASTSRVQAHTDRPMVRLVLPPPQHSLRHMRGCPVWLPGMQAEVRWAEQAYRKQEVMVLFRGSGRGHGDQCMHGVLAQR